MMSPSLLTRIFGMCRSNLLGLPGLGSPPLHHLFHNRTLTHRIARSKIQVSVENAGQYRSNECVTRHASAVSRVAPARLDALYGLLGCTYVPWHRWVTGTIGWRVGRNAMPQ